MANTHLKKKSIMRHHRIEPIPANVDSGLNASMVLHKPAKPKAATSLILRSSPPADAGRLPLAVRYIEKSEGNAFAAASSVDFFFGEESVQAERKPRCLSKRIKKPYKTVVSSKSAPLRQTG